MRNLLRFLYQYRIFGLFLLLEGFSVWLIINSNRFYNAYYINSSNEIAGNIARFTSNSKNYFALVKTNRQLAEENAFLRQHLINRQSIHRVDPPQEIFSVIAAEVINNTFQKSANYLTINAGLKQGLKPKMGVISDNGIVGVVRSVSENFATVVSLLHQDLLVSSQLKKTGTLCTVEWDGRSPIYSSVNYIPRHIEIEQGDSVVTSGFNAVYPKGLFIGTVESFELNEENPFYDARLKLAEDFTSLEFVFIIVNRFKSEKDSLESVKLF